jgi:hypothetical protein
MDSSFVNGSIFGTEAESPKYQRVVENINKLELYGIYTGKEFNELTQGKKFVKITVANDIHRDFKYKTGENELPYNEPFNPEGQCSGGGFYFFEDQNVYSHVKFYFEDLYYRNVVVPDDTLIYVENNKYKINKFELSDKQPLERLSVWQNMEYCMKAISFDIGCVKYCPKHSLIINHAIASCKPSDDCLYLDELVHDYLTLELSNLLSQKYYSFLREEDKNIQSSLDTHQSAFSCCLGGR